MRNTVLRTRGFSLLELLLAMALFTIAAVSLAETLNQISFTVTESIDDTRINESVRSLLTETTRTPIRGEDSWRTEPDDAGIVYEITIEESALENQEGQRLDGLYEVTVEAIRNTGESVYTHSTLVNPDIFSL